MSRLRTYVRLLLLKSKAITKISISLLKLIAWSYLIFFFAACKRTTKLLVIFHAQQKSCFGRLWTFNGKKFIAIAIWTFSPRTESIEIENPENHDLIYEMCVPCLDCHLPFAAEFRDGTVQFIRSAVDKTLFALRERAKSNRGHAIKRACVNRRTCIHIRIPMIQDI